MSERESHSEHVESETTSDGNGTTEHTTVEKDGETVSDETTHED